MDLIECRDVDCTVHKSMIASLYNKVIAILTAAAKHAIPFTSPKSHYNKSQPGWNEQVSVFKDEAINWHVIWKMSGSPPEGYLLEMRKASRAKYHKQIKFKHNHRNFFKNLNRNPRNNHVTSILNSQLIVNSYTSENKDINMLLLCKRSQLLLSVLRITSLQESMEY